MAEFNAYPALSVIPGINLGNVLQQAAGIQAARNENALAPLEQQALDQENQLRGVAVQQAKQQSYNSQLLQAAETVDDNDPAAASRQWDENMQRLVDSGHPEAKQFIGRYSLRTKDMVRALYGAPPPTARGANVQGPGLGGAGPQSALGGSPDASQLAALGQMQPNQLQDALQRTGKIVGEINRLYRAGADGPKVWADLQKSDPLFAQHFPDPYDPNKLRQMKAWADQQQAVLSQRGFESATGFPTSRPTPEIKTAGEDIFAVDPYAVGGPTAKSIAQGGSAKEAETMRHNKADELLSAGRLAEEVRANKAKELGDAPTTMSEVDPQSGSILAQTGLNFQTFLALTGQSSKLPRDAKTREAAFNEAQQFANKNNVDVSTFGSQYQALNETLASNIKRVNQTRIMEQEMGGTIDNLKPVADEAGLGKLRVANVGKLFAGQEFNDPLVQQYSFQLNQLRSELAAYNGAVQGRTGNALTIQDYNEAEKVIKNGLSSKSADGLKTAVSTATNKMGQVLDRNVDVARKGVWDLFGVGDKYKDKFSSQPRTTAAESPHPTNLPPGTQFSPSRQQYRTPDGKILDKDGNPVK